MSQVKYLIIGGSHAGLCALEAIRFQDEEGEIAMVSREQSLPYSPTILPYVISGKKQTDTILLRDESYFTDLNVQFMPGSTVVAVNPAEAMVALQSGETIRYEKLLLATGADAAVPPFPGIDTVSYPEVAQIHSECKIRHRHRRRADRHAYRRESGPRRPRGSHGGSPAGIAVCIF